MPSRSIRKKMGEPNATLYDYFANNVNSSRKRFRPASDEDIETNNNKKRTKLSPFVFDKEQWPRHLINDPIDENQQPFTMTFIVDVTISRQEEVWFYQRQFPHQIYAERFHHFINQVRTWSIKGFVEFITMYWCNFLDFYADNYDEMMADVEEGSPMDIYIQNVKSGFFFEYIKVKSEAEAEQNNNNNPRNDSLYCWKDIKNLSTVTCSFASRFVSDMIFIFTNPDYDIHDKMF